MSNILEGLPFASNSFDFVLVQLFGTTFFTKNDWKDKIIHEIARLAKPGVLNHLQLKDINGSICENFGLGQISQIKYEVVIGPIGSWGRRAGELGSENFYVIKLKKQLVLIFIFASSNSALRF
ncbi:S-adenosyl-L-methionine-dependent methyltransferase [Gigaspora margarita]|uniref:S-adenosyl-L-methionine-dependent methyltransferase n=1 Tax=Gigaspora margarita TaxID=4874 RepID=A0A8H3WYF9_GIGMA|nr:S-adenosyl-L-methionine-dependent methyltransferase [Gigaspora margarita]